MTGKFKPRQLPRPHIQHLDLENRKQVIARLLLIRCLKAQPLDLTEQELEIFDQINKDGLQKADHITSLKNPNICLDDHLKTVLEALKKTYQHVLEVLRQTQQQYSQIEHFKNEVSQRIDDFERNINNIRCIHSKLADDDNVTTSDKVCECWQPLQELFDFVLGETEKVYRQYAYGFAKAPDVEVTYITKQTVKPGIVATTKFPKDDKESARQAHITIGLPVNSFDAQHYFELLYDLFHETAVHAPQAIKTPGPRQPYGENCPFSEGLVDSATYHITCEILKKKRYLPQKIDPLADPFLKGTKQKYQERNNYNLPHSILNDHSMIAACHARARGSDVFYKLLELRGSGTKRSKKWVMRLVLSLNLYPFSKQQRLDFVTKLNTTLRISTIGLPSNDSHAARLRALDEYVEKGNIEVLLNAFGLY